jgi:tryptophan-rich sensory protein
MVGIVGSLFTMPQIKSWYATLSKPAFTPPNWVFAPVWTTLYLLMGVALYLIIKNRKSFQDIKTPLTLFIIQLIFNAIWSPVFFGLESIIGGLFIIVILLFLIGLTIYHFYKVSKLAAFLLLPYILWVSYATALNFALFSLNVL